MAMQVEGKTAIITGAGSGINLCFAKLLLSRGCNIVIADLALRLEASELVAKYPLESTGPRAVFQKTDVTEWAQLDKMFDVAVEHFGGADIVCPGAGVYEPPFSNFWVEPGVLPSKDRPSESRYSILDINLTHPIRVTQLAITHFLKRKKQGVVVHISSIAGQVPFFPTPIYVATKHALSGFVRSLSRLEYPPAHLSHLPKIRVNAVAPARIQTPLWTEHPEKMKLIGKDPTWVSPEAVADLMLDLVTKDEYIGGSIVEIGANIRFVQAYDDPGPGKSGNGLDRAGNEEEDMWASLEKQFGRE